MAVALVTTTAPYKALDGEDLQWLKGVEDRIKLAEDAGLGPVYIFAALEIDSRGKGMYASLFARFNELEAQGISCSYWTFQLNDHADEVDGINRLFRICTGRNLCHEWAIRDASITHLFFIDSDLMIPNDSIVKLMEVGQPVAGGDVPAYCLGVGHPFREEYGYPVCTHWNTAGFLLVNREVFRRIRWRHDLEAGATDDPCFAADAEAAGFGPTFVRKDLIGIHGPLVPMEHRGHDRSRYE